MLDQARLSFGRDVPLGRYDVAIGLYDHAASDARLPAFDAQGRLLPDARVVLTSIEITP